MCWASNIIFLIELLNIYGLKATTQIIIQQNYRNVKVEKLFVKIFKTLHGYELLSTLQDL